MDTASVSVDYLPKELVNISKKIKNKERVSDDEALFLLENASLALLGSLANQIRECLHGDKTYFNKNIHIEPTNICVFDCKFCSYSRLLREKEQGWEHSEKEMLDMLNNAPKDITEVHIVGGVHPKMGLDFFANLIKKIKKLRPQIHVKAFTAVELEYICRKAKVSYKEGLQILKDAGQDSLPGGGAEIFDQKVRREICKDKCSSAQWLEIHKAAHTLGMPSNATMLYGHIEKPKHIIDHMSRLRNLQDNTGGFNTFIPLKFRNKNNQMSHINETSVIEDMRIFAIARIYLDNFKHLKAYWPMIGKQSAQTLLAFGVNDIDGTIDDTTKIYSMAGAEDQNPKMTTEDIVDLIKKVKRQPIERDTLYNTIKDFN
ncbi:MAG: aminofutalosine synthase MqnE [Flavobacteriales bacterium TMED123]|nr:MAG: aminofutalosine synthase MqnE [Flavobacteriales bacterium TMED123]|tara:strand:+ start:5975 stop:7093 length:1119 start_codon:yes stop_codon:yes gene_type:complete